MIANIKYALRLMLKKPFFTLLTLYVLTQGMSSVLTTFSIVNVISYKDLDFPNGDRMIIVDAREKKRYRFTGRINHFDFLHYQQNQTKLEHLAAFKQESACITSTTESECYIAAKVQPEVFALLKTNPVLGSSFNIDETLIHSAPVAIISHELWTSRYLNDTDIIGKQIIINGINREVIGVMPAGFKFPNSAMVWLPLIADLSLERNKVGSVAGLAFLKPGVSLADVKTELKFLAKQLNINRNSEAGISAFATSLKLWSLGQHNYKIFNTMFLCVFFVLLVACANVASLLLANAFERKRETAIRMALGAPRWKIIAQRLTESFIICLIGGIFAVSFTAWELESMNAELQKMLDFELFWWDFKMEPDTLVFALAILFLTTLLSALYPAVKASKADFNNILKDGSYGSESKESGRLMKLLIIFEIALSCALVITASLMATASYIDSNVDFGINTEGYLTAEYVIPKSLYNNNIENLEVIKESIRLSILKEPGIGGVSLSSVVPAKDGAGISYHKPGEVYNNPEDYPVAGWGFTDKAYFETFNIQLLQGRFYDDLDFAGKLVKTVVSKSFADQTWPDQNAIGKRFFVNTREKIDAYEMEVIGIVPHVINDTGPEMIKRGSIYVPSYLKALDEGYISLKTSSDNPVSLAKILKKAVYQISPDIRIKNIMSLEDGIAQSASKIGMIGGVYLDFGILALIFTLAGIYGVMSKSIQQKTKEIGIRRALGAMDKSIFFWLLRKGWWQLTIGLILGLILGGLLTYALMDMIAIVGQLIPVIFLLVTFFIILVVNAAIAIPARKAIKIEPSTALHFD